MRNKLLNLLFEPNLENYMLSTINGNRLDPNTFLLYYHLVYLRSSSKREKMELMYNNAELLLSKKDTAEWYLTQIN